MSILWLIIGFVIGLLVAWFYLDTRYKRLSAERQAELLNNTRQAEEALEREKDAHNTTTQRISELETQQTLAREQAASLTAELKKNEGNLEQAEAASGKNRDLQEQLRQRDADIRRLETDLAEYQAKSASTASAPSVAASAAGTAPAMRQARRQAVRR
jgi:F0F1-type ATP synthase membrane subunit b/b'